MTFYRLFLFLSIAFVSFVFSFVPLVVFFRSDFLTMNPFIIQSSFLIPKIYTVLFILIAILLTFLVKSKADKFFFSGISLFISIFIYSIYHLIHFGYEVSYINSKIDISYFIFCIPFLIMYLFEIDRSKSISG